MPKISFAAHISPREAIERRSRSPYLPGAVRIDVNHLSRGGSTHAIHAEVDDDDGILPADSRRLQRARDCCNRSSSASRHPARFPIPISHRASAAPRCSAQLRKLPDDVADPPVADGRFPLYRE